LISEDDAEGADVDTAVSVVVAFELGGLALADSVELTGIFDLLVFPLHPAISDTNKAKTNTRTRYVLFMDLPPFIFMYV